MDTRLEPKPTRAYQRSLERVKWVCRDRGMNAMSDCSVKERLVGRLDDECTGEKEKKEGEGRRGD